MQLAFKWINRITKRKRAMLKTWCTMRSFPSTWLRINCYALLQRITKR